MFSATDLLKALRPDPLAILAYPDHALRMDINTDPYVHRKENVNWILSVKRGGQATWTV